MNENNDSRRSIYYLQLARIKIYLKSDVGLNFAFGVVLQLSLHKVSSANVSSSCLLLFSFG